MDQNFFNIIIGVSGAFGGWLLKIIFDAIKDLKDEIKELRKEVHEDFVRRDDYSEAVVRIEKMCGKIFDKLDGKVDK